MRSPGLARQPDDAAADRRRGLARARGRGRRRGGGGADRARHARRRDLRALPQAPVAAPRRPRARAPPRRPLGGGRRDARRDHRGAGPDRAARRAGLDRPRPVARARLAQPAVRRHRPRPARDLRAARAEGASWWRALRELEAPSAALERARDAARALAALVAALPPHDLLDRIVVEGDAHARYAAAVPPEQRAFALDAIDAVLAQSLYLDGGRYATPYAFVRALKQRRREGGAAGARLDRAPAHVHGAKGLEADTVFVMDAEPERQQPADDDAARRVAGRGRAADALCLRLQREPLPALAARRARRRDAGAASARS